MASILEKIAPAQSRPIKPAAGTVQWLNERIARGGVEVFSETVTVTPGLANVILGKNEANRHVRETKMLQYAADMRSGSWVFNGEPIIVAKTGELNDGQHRLHALIEANISLPFLFVFGVERETRTTVDQGAARSACDYLAMQGVPNSTTQASIARQLIAYERSGGQGLGGSGYVTNAEVLERVHSDPEIGTAATFAGSHAKSARAFAHPAIIGLCLYLFSQLDEQDAKTYMTQVCDGENLAKRDPAYTVRERLLALETRSRDVKVHIIFRGWNAYRQGRQLSIAKIVGGANNLPAII